MIKIIEKISFYGVCASFVFCVLYLANCVINYYNSKRYGSAPTKYVSIKSKSIALVFSFLFVLSIIGFIATNPLFVHMIGYRNLDLEPKGKYTYYAEVYVYETGRHGIVPVQVIKDDDLYYIEKVALSDSEIIDLFCDDEIYSVEIGKSTDLPINDGKYEDKYVEVKLINDHAIFPSFADDNGDVPTNIILLVVGVVSTFSTIIILFKSVEKAQHERDDNSNKK